eukprot:3584120-Prymnesium_polylepis.1
MYEEGAEQIRERERDERTRRAAELGEAMGKVKLEEVVDVEEVAEEELVLDTGTARAERLAGLEPKPEEAPIPSVTGKTLIFGVGKRIQDERHKIWLPQ